MRRILACAALVAVAGMWCAGCGGGGGGSSTTVAQPVPTPTPGTVPATAGGTASAATPATTAGGSRSAKPGSSSVAACSLVTRRDATAAFGRSASKGITSSGGQTCDYTGGLSIHVTVRPEGRSDFDRKEIRKAAARAGIRPVPGMGDAAFVQTYAVDPGASTTSALTTFVDAGSYVSITVTVPVARKASVAAVVIELGRAAARRLEQPRRTAAGGQ